MQCLIQDLEHSLSTSHAHSIGDRLTHIPGFLPFNFLPHIPHLKLAHRESSK
ncbi:hypothetical protein [Nostoc sp. C052]|uniref:hypothetical protein n=1 Tax=Nostoc sp. C052 TaxID=2576902 RepID=UPI0015C3A349|nr:hypothetical protein [Nostoc sp. C052]